MERATNSAIVGLFSAGTVLSTTISLSAVGEVDSRVATQLTGDAEESTTIALSVRDGIDLTDDGLLLKIDVAATECVLGEQWGDEAEL